MDRLTISSVGTSSPLPPDGGGALTDSFTSKFVSSSFVCTAAQASTPPLELVGENVLGDAVEGAWNGSF